MSALGELLIYLIYFILGLPIIISLIRAFRAQKHQKKRLFIRSLFFGFLLFSFTAWQRENHRKDELSNVGVYYLENYPRCDSCYLELKEDMTYIVVNKGKTIETSTWHYESGGDYWITYLGNDNQHLGSGDYVYHRYKLKSSNE